MSEQQMPNFALSELAFTSDEEMQEDARKQSARFFDKPGQYDLRITEATYQGAAEKDPKWGKVYITLEGANGREIKDTLLLPMAGDIKYGEKGQTFPFHKLRGFTSSLGQSLSVAEGPKGLNKQLSSLFYPIDKLIGKSLKANIGYRAGYVRYVGKKDDGSKMYELVASDGNVVSENGEAKRFPDVAAAQQYATDNSIKFDKFISVLDYCEASKTADSSSKKGNW